MALKGVNILEIAGLAPAPFCGMILADFGASVTRVDKTTSTPDIDCLSNGKKSIAINLKAQNGAEVFKKLCTKADVLIEPFRKGVMERLSLGPEVLMRENPQLIYARLSGFGHQGAYSERAGHDINYVAMSGVLSLLRQAGGPPTPPVNLIADFAGGGLTCALGIVLALLERQRSHVGQVVDCSMTAGSAYLGSWLLRSQRALPVWGQPPGNNALDGGAHFYCTYETKDGEWMAVGALEPQFYEQLLLGLGLDDVPQFPEDPNEGRKIFVDKFKEKTRDEWCKIFDKLDACVTPVLSPLEAARDAHNVANNTFTQEEDPNPAPWLSRTPAQSCATKPRPRQGEHTRETLRHAGFTDKEITELTRQGVVGCRESKL